MPHVHDGTAGCEWTPADAGFVVTPEAIQNLPTDDPAMTTVLQPRLGLKLETRKAPVPVVVMDSVAMPTPD